jgi:tRNA-dihydrouridine synthase
MEGSSQVQAAELFAHPHSGGGRGGGLLSIGEKIDILLEQLHINVERIDERRGILHTRRHLAASPIFKGIPDFRQTRIAMLRAETVSELTEIIEQVRKRLVSA